MKNFKDKTVLITGASRGIGKEFAEVLAPLKCRLILTARSKADLESLAGTLSKKHKTPCHIFTENLSDLDAPKRLFDSIKGAGLDVDVLINNAGFGKTGIFLENDFKQYASMLDLNIKALVELTQLYLTEFVKKKDGGIINVASTAAFQPVPFMSIYAATKAFVLSFSEGLSYEYRNSGVTITCLCPGGTDTAFHSVSNTDMKKSGFMKIGLQNPREVAETGVRDFLRGKRLSITSPLNFILANSNRLVPRNMALGISGSLFRSKLSNS